MKILFFDDFKLGVLKGSFLEDWKKPEDHVFARRHH